MNFGEKVAIVTGAAGGIGEAYARALAAQGAHVVVADINEAEGRRVANAIKQAGSSAIFAAVDIGDNESAQALAAVTQKEFGRIDYLVNNAALFGGMRLSGLLDTDLDYYNRFMAINFHGCLLTTRAVVPHMRVNGGAIVNQTSTAAYMGYGPYSVAKLGMNGITMALARELGPMNIRINGIAPGPTDTPALRTTTSAEYLQAMTAAMPIARLGTPDDLVGAMLFLLSDEARWITGHILNVDGGQWMRV